jgi:hypothetical protein
MTITITRAYDRYADVRAVVGSLKSAGIAEHQISVIANEAHYSDELDATDAPASEGSSAGTGATVGATLGGGAGLLAGLGLLAIPGAGPIVAAGWLAAAAAGAVSGAVAGAAAGGIVGALTDSGVDADDAESYAEAVRRGATLVSVRTEPSEEDHVRSLMDAYNPADIEMRRAKWEEEGWTNYDTAAKPYTPEQRRAEMDRWM